MVYVISFEDLWKVSLAQHRLDNWTMSQSTVGDGHDMIYHIDNEDRFHSWQILIFASVMNVMNIEVEYFYA